MNTASPLAEALTTIPDVQLVLIRSRRGPGRCPHCGGRHKRPPGECRSEVRRYLGRKKAEEVGR